MCCGVFKWMKSLSRLYFKSRGVFKCISMDSVTNVDIDPSGRFKYILIKVVDKAASKEKFVVRGYGHCGFHGDIFDEVSPVIEKQGLEADCVGGGRIIHDPDGKHIQVFGYSQACTRLSAFKTAFDAVEDLASMDPIVQLRSKSSKFS